MAQTGIVTVYLVEGLSAAQGHKLQRHQRWTPTEAGRNNRIHKNRDGGKLQCPAAGFPQVSQPAHVSISRANTFHLGQVGGSSSCLSLTHSLP